ncbi:MAG: amino acid permease [Haloferacaceae archaeon]
MTKDLERDLGLYATVTISIGAMIGSGIFVLPGLAARKAGPAVVLAYLLAGLFVLPAALSKAEMATAIPEAGGTYLYIDRAMGPLPGTVAGIGAWFSLVFKSAFALVGLGAYLLVLVDLPEGLLTLIGLGLGVLLLVVNVVGVKQSGRFQAVIVSLVLLTLLAFVADGSTFVDRINFRPFFPKGPDGLLAATGFVFVSYAGVTKIASVAEEVEEPGRNIPRAMLGSVVGMMLVYTLVVFVLVGVMPVKSLYESLTPMAAAAESFAGPTGRIVLAVVAVLALTSMANAGILSSSRFPFAMSRDALAPERLRSVHARFKTPVWSIGLTGVLLLALIALVPVRDLAKLASAFKILVFVFVNVALIAFRESDLSWYDPEFVAPGYPWVQAFGILGGGVLLTQMGPVALGGAAGIVLVGLGWYGLYGRERTQREGAALDAIRQSATDRALAATRRTLADGGGNVLVAMGADTTVERERALLTVAAAVASRRGGRVHAVRFEEVPDQLSLSSATDMTEADRAFEAQTEELAASLPAAIEAREIVSHGTPRAVVNYAADVEAEVVLGAWTPTRFGAELLGADVDWYMKHAPCETVFLRDRGLDPDAVDEIAVIAQRGPYDPFKLVVADAVAAGLDARVRLVTAVEAPASEELLDATRSFHADLDGLCSVPTESVVVETDDRTADLADAAADVDLAVLGIAVESRLHELTVGDPARELGDALGCPVLLVHSQLGRHRSFVREAVERVAF